MRGMEIQSPGLVTACSVSFHLQLWSSTGLHRALRLHGGALGTKSRDDREDGEGFAEINGKQMAGCRDRSDRTEEDSEEERGF